MATQEEVFSKADELGTMIADLDSAKELKSSEEALMNDTATRQAMQQFEEFAQGLAQKQAQGLPIEPSEKQTLEQLQMSIVSSPLLARYQQAQMAHTDTLRKVHEKIIGEQAPAADPAAGGAPGGNPGGLII